VSGLDLPLVWAAAIALAVLLYVLLDGFDLGVGILSVLAGSSRDRDVMMHAVAPYWDGNETWLVLGGGGLFAAFPGAYAALMPAFYLPIVLMLLALILRGVAFEFRAHGRRRGRAFWTAAFALGSIVATLSQGLVLGGFVGGVTLAPDGAFAGRPFDWLSPYAVLTAIGLLAGYALLGAGWLLLKTSGEVQRAARRWAAFAALATAGLLAVVGVATLFVNPFVAARWGWTVRGFDAARLAPLLPIPALGAIGFALVAMGVARRADAWPFVGAALVFLSGYLGLTAGFFPYVVPYGLTYRTAANDSGALGLLTGGLVVILPLIVAYTAWVFWVFRGKADAGYH
jgi:cytochrome d ubiquinol oxidase subunit II